MVYSLTALFIGFILDFFIGDPEGIWHPVRLIGSLISSGEQVLRKIGKKSKTGELIAGVILVFLVIGLCTLVPFGILFMMYRYNIYAGLILETIMCYQLLATKSLKTESMKVFHALDKQDIENGRRAVSMIVGRDTENLSKEGIIKATVETVAENASDGSIAPLFYMALGGAPLGFFYKSINTMDSMIGYKNQKYEYFGRFAAKLDDVVNFVPARISAYLMIVSTVFTGFDTKGAWKIYRRDRFNHESPNSAHTEAVMAGALGVQLAGDAWYFGKLHKKKTIGEEIRPVENEDIKRANYLLYLMAILGMIVFGGIKYLFLWFFF